MLEEIPLSRLAVGMFVECYGDGSLRNPLHHLREYIHSPRQIEDLKKLGVERVTIDPARTKKPSQPVIPGVAGPPYVFHGLAVARKAYAQCLAHVVDVMQRVRQGLEVDYTRSYEAVDILMGSVEANPAHMTLLAKLHHFDDYTFRHSLNVALLSLVFGRHLGCEEVELRRLGFSGLYHDVGKFRIPPEILNKPGRLTEQEFAVMRTHCQLGFELLKGHPGIDEDVLWGILHHHERFDGNGYPLRLKAEDRDEFSRIITIVDIFDALSSDRPYKEAYTPHESLRIMFSGREKSFHPGLMEKFVECFGVYPPGSFVRLSDKTCGVVVQARPESPARPVVKVAFSKKLVPILPTFVDLSVTPKACDGGLDIEACLNPAEFGIVVERFI